ncbi:MAG: cobalamin-dependent protein, partial [Candidatus Edwardsbacteria bacterium]
MRILLIRTTSPTAFPGMILHIVPPLGLMYLASALRKWCQVECKLKISHLMLNGFELSDLKKEVEDFNPQLLGLSTLSYETPRMHAVAQMIKAMNPSCKVVVGGPHATAFSSHILQDKNIDYIIIGEGEKTFVELVEAIEADRDVKGIKGIGYRQNGTTIYTPPREYISNPDDIPFPAWDLIDFPDYLKTSNMSNFLAERNYAPIFTSRACPYSCIYCHRIFGKGWRARSPENVI